MATIINEERKFALQKFLENLINPLNVFETALRAAENSQIKEVATYAKGFEMLYNQIEDVIFNVGVSKIIPKIGDPFDPNIHQIYETIESDHPKDSIIEIKNIGYKLHDRTIRPALVVVAK